MHAAANRPRRRRAPRGGFAFAPGEELHDLLWPMSPAEFVAEYFEQRPLHIRGGAEKFARLFDRALYDRAIEQGVALRVDFPPRDGRAGQTFPCQLNQTEPLLALGGTICAYGLHERIPRLGRVVDNLKRQLRYPGVVDIRCYHSGDGAGFATHFDARVAAALQIVGKKRWRFSREPAVRQPPTNACKTIHGFVYSPPQPQLPPPPTPDESQFIEVVLEPGDLLCLPSGTWHEASGVGESLALTIAFNPCTPVDLFVDLLRRTALTRESWRRALPPALAVENAPLQTLAAEALAAPLAELQEVAAAALPSLTREWHRRALPRPRAAVTARPLGRKQRLRRATPISLYRDGDALLVYPGELRVDAALLPVLERLARSERLTAEALQSWARGRALTWPRASALLKTLLDAGILELDE